MNAEQFELAQKKIIETLKVKPVFEIQNEIQTRIQFLKETLKKTQRKTYVLGISGGIDSTVAGRLAQLAVESLRQENYKCHFIAMRLPYGIQHDEKDAALACDFIQPDELLTVNIKPAGDALLQTLREQNLIFLNEKHQDFIFGNIKARQRMIIQYSVAGTYDGLVIGTDHAAEALMGFFTKFGDGACDLAPLTGLNKRRIRSIAKFLSAPEQLINKCPTADLEELCPLRPDEEAFGITYHEIDDFLEGKIMSSQVYKIIFQTYHLTEHKRMLPLSP